MGVKNITFDIQGRRPSKIQILAIAAVVALLPLTAAPQNHFFAATASNPARLASFKMKLVDQICEASGGPCKYTGKDMKTAHQGMGISTGDFNALVEDLVGALDKFNVGAAEKNQLLGVLGLVIELFHRQSSTVLLAARAFHT